MRLEVMGAGQMAEALVRAILDGGLLSPAQVTAIDPAPERRAVFASLGCQAAERHLADDVFDAILLAVKPQQAEEALGAIAAGHAGAPLLISVMAGVATSRLAASCPRFRVIRAMPNLPAAVGAGATGVALGPGATEDDMRLALRLFSAGGKAWQVDESMLDAVTAVSGSGPAYFFRLTEALAEAGRAAGLPPDVADGLARETLWGAAMLLRGSPDSPAAWRGRVTSPGGTTAAAMAVLDGEGEGPGAAAHALSGSDVNAGDPSGAGRGERQAGGRMAVLVREAVFAARRRAGELSAAAH